MTSASVMFDDVLFRSSMRSLMMSSGVSGPGSGVDDGRVVLVGEEVVPLVAEEVVSAVVDERVVLVGEVVVLSVVVTENSSLSIDDEKCLCTFDTHQLFTTLLVFGHDSPT